jgi:hypothetical protein
MSKKLKRRIRSLSVKHLQLNCWNRPDPAKDELMRQEFINECKVVGTGRKPVTVDIKTADGSVAWSTLRSGTVVTPELQQSLQEFHDQVIAPHAKKREESMRREIAALISGRAIPLQ